MTTTEIITIAAAAAAALATIALAATTYQYLKRTDKLIEISNRPQVLLYSDNGKIIIENIGTQTAFNIRFHTKNPNYKEHENGTPFSKQDWYENEIRMMPPQMGQITHNLRDEGKLIKQPPCEMEIIYHTEAGKKGTRYEDTTYVGSYPGGYSLYSKRPLRYQPL